MEIFKSEPPRHNVIDSQFDCRGSTIIVMCHGKKFDIRVEAEDLQGTAFSAQYDQFYGPLQNDEEDVDAYETMCDWMLDPCLPILSDITAQTPHHLELTLQDFYFPSTFRLRLVVSNQKLNARHVLDNSLGKEWSLAISNDQLPPFPDVLRLPASTIKIVSDESDDYGCEIPRRVRTDGKAEYFFKPALDESQYIRETQSLIRIAHAGVGNGLRVSKLVGIVTSDDMKWTIGLLLEWIPSFSNLQSTEARRQAKFHEQWKHQITTTVNELHKHGITWGDVHPGNIIIDTQMDAWVVDFGGGWVEPFVTRKTFGTVEGDLLGIENVFENLRTWEARETQSAAVDTD